ncbi:hypothetical protein NLJ89_g2607 [Agrocybe chaxingu]|uniref:Uncharacterized protein n=1 Tax=Agrocybe chaxingu TaxID=84603 RepID=A0A9W8MWB3_9AGAR|nr:hypothetical protein NLJ89_g2607 [Agrocybe chaxingu]
MGVELPYLPTLDIHASNPFLSPNSAILKRQLERLNDFREKRAGVTKKQEKDAVRRLAQQQYHDDKLKATLPEVVYSALKENPRHYGAPRRFAVLIAPHAVVHKDEMIYDASKYVFEGHTIHFSAFKTPETGFWINNSWVPPSQILLSPNKTTYTFSAHLKNKDGGGILHGYLNFVQEDMPHGLLIHNNEEAFAIQLKPYASQYSIAVSADAGAVWSSGNHELSWDVKSAQWKNATWENKAGVFAYDIATNDDPILPISVIEVGITDNKSTHPATPPSFDYALTLPDRAKYTAVFQQVKDQTYFRVLLKDNTLIPPRSAARKASAIKTLFGTELFVTFDGSAFGFVGAYIDKDQRVYAIKGQAIFPAPPASPSIVGPKAVSTPKLLSELHPSPVLAEAAHHASLRKLFAKTPPLRGAFPTLASSDLNITGLLNLNPMQQDKDGQWFDAAGRAAMSDLHDGILTFMDDGLHNTFVGGNRPNLTPDVRNIIFSNPTENARFYKTLQVPFLTASLSSSTQPSAQLLNGSRAAKVLRDLPANDPVYQQQSSELYSLRWKQMYPIIQEYLDDQSSHDYTDAINTAGAYLKKDLQDRFKDVPDPDGSQAAAIKKAQDDLDDLQTYAVSNNLYWAMMLFYYTQTYYLPFLQSKMASSTLSAEISNELKAYGATLGILESNGSTANGNSFQAAFNDMIQAFTLTTILPQYMDAEGNKTDYISYLDAIMEQFLKTYATSGDPDIQEYVADITALRGDRQAIELFMNLLISVSRTTAASLSWASLVEKMRVLADADGYYSKLARGAGMLGSFLMLACVVSLVMVFRPGKGWASMTDLQRAYTVTSALSIFVFALVKIAQRGARIINFWSDLGTAANRMKVLLAGNEELINAIGPASKDAQSTFTRWLTRTTKESMEMDASEAAPFMKYFGRNASEFLARTAGIVLGLVNIALAAWTIATTSDPLEKDMAILNIVSGGLAILGIAAGWIASSIALTSIEAGLIAGVMVGVLEFAAAVLGPLSLAFAVAGMIVMIVMMFRHQDPPDPLKDFAEGQAKDIGLYMPKKTQIDYFNVIPPNGPLGISHDGLVLMNGTKYVQISALKVGPGGPISAPVVLSGAITYKPDVCLNVQTDSKGFTRIWTPTTDANGKTRAQVCLSVDDSSQIIALPPPSKTRKDDKGNTIPADPVVYAKLVKQQQWIFDCTQKGASVMVEDASYVTTAGFTIRSAATNSYLTVDAQATRVQLAGSPQEWICRMESIGPSGFSYAGSPWTIYTDSRDELIAAQMDSPGSEPLTWTIKPTLPAGLEIRSDGSIAIMANKIAAKSPKTIYTVTASITINGNKYAQSADVTIEVAVPP